MIIFQIKRLITQISVFISVNLGVFGFKTGFCFPFFYCHSCPSASGACPLRAIEKGVYDNSFKWKLLFFPLLIIGFVGTLSGRAVCGWACPIGLLQRATGKFARKIKKTRLGKIVFPNKIDQYLRYSKYFVFIGLVILTTYFIGFMFTDICPVGVLTGTIPIIILNPGQFVPSGYFLPALIVLVLFILLILLVERGWCRYFCPVGAILAPFNKISLLYVNVDAEKCIHCNKCSEICPMGIDVPNMNRDPECIMCGKCVNICPENAISFKMSGMK